MNEEETLHNFQKAYNALSQLEKDVLSYMTIAFEQLSKEQVIAFLHRRVVRGDTFFGKKSYSMSDVKTALSRLRKKSFIIFELRYRCNEGFSEKLMEYAMERKDSQTLIDIVREVIPSESSHQWHAGQPTSKDVCYREIRIGIFTNDFDLIQKYEKLCEEYFTRYITVYEVFYSFTNLPFPLEWFRSRHPAIQKRILPEVLYHRMVFLKPTDDIAEFLDRVCQQTGDYEYRLREIYANTLILQGNLSKTEDLIGKNNPSDRLISREASIAFLSGEYEMALQLYQEALKDMRRQTGRRNVTFNDTCGCFYALEILTSGDITRYNELEKYLVLVKKERLRLPSRYACIQAMLAARKNRLREYQSLISNIAPEDMVADPFVMLLYFLSKYWFSPSFKESDDPSLLKKGLETSLANGYKLYAMEFAGILGELGDKKAAEISERLSEETGMPGLRGLIVKEDEWLTALKNLANTKFIAQQKGKSTAEAAECRMVWMLGIKGQNVTISPKEQKITKKGTWTAGRKVALKRLKAGELDYLTAADRKIAATIEEVQSYGYYYNSDTSFDFNLDKTLVAMIGHPYLFLEQSPDIPVEFIKSEPELVVSETKKGFELAFNLDVQRMGTHIIKDTPTRYRIVSVTESHTNIFETLGTKKLKVPAEGKGLLLDAVKNISSLLTVHSSVEGVASEVPLVKADSQVRAFLLPLGDGFKAELFVKPFGDDGPYYKPGSGGENVFAEIKGERLQSKRNIKEEKKNVSTLIEACPILTPLDKVESLVLENPEECLELLLELHEAKDLAQIEWPKGGKLKLLGEASQGQMKMKVKKQNDWFELSGELKINESLVLNMQELISFAEKSKTRFIPLGEGQFIALTEEFRRRLANVSSYSESKGKGVTFHPLATMAMQDFAEDVKSFKGDAHWKRQLEKIEEANNLKPVIPSTFQAELRDYQIEGYNWLARLAAWGVGACLADDMGLGKTIQSLAIILERAKNGPSLVVAPASVGMNWINEAARFAPTLNVVLLGPKGRKETLKGLGEFDLLVCSYGILQSEEKALSGIQWSTIVLDEAQFIKNANTKRSKAAMKMQGDFKLITTGTPVENHLGELWNLFNFINPGLLGTIKSFRERFAAPIEESGDKETRLRLKRLIQPFILRRLKNEVLDELPPKTEILLSVEMSPEETAFYEALRRKAADNLKGLNKPAGETHIKILAEIMKLRRACCHARLVAPDSALKSSKFELFWQTAEELMENKHKVLVFSQFVDHLSLLRDEVEKRGIPYQYLDGSTSIKEREKRVKAFQQGEGNIFLISLKAGGVGLNLTAANYVIHMDPWWNPAVEDQASDRSHRIGQKCPVTIYRLVTKGTIEEKIVQLHHDKRGLANSLLEGTGATGKMSSEDLLRLIASA